MSTKPYVYRDTRPAKNVGTADNPKFVIVGTADYRKAVASNALYKPPTNAGDSMALANNGETVTTTPASGLSSSGGNTRLLNAPNENAQGGDSMSFSIIWNRYKWVILGVAAVAAVVIIRKVKRNA